MPKRRSKDAQVVASPVAHANHGLLIQFVSNAYTRSKMLVVSYGIAAQIYAVLSSDAHFTGHWVNPTAQALTRDSLRPIDFPAQAKIQGQFVGRTPRVLSVEKQAGLSFVGVGGRAHEA